MKVPDYRSARAARFLRDVEVFQAHFALDADIETTCARLQIVDQERGSWGNIGVDEIVFTDEPAASEKLEEQGDFGSMVLALLAGGATDVTATANRAGACSL